MNKPVPPPHQIITDSYREVGEALLKKLASAKKPKKAS